MNTGEVITGALGRGGMFATSDAVVLGDARQRRGQAGAGRAARRGADRRVDRTASCERLRGSKRSSRSRRRESRIPSSPIACSTCKLRSFCRRARRTPLVGRDGELAALVGEFEAVVAEPSCRLATVVGEPGVGKSRLAAELIERIGVRGRDRRGGCLAYGEGVTYWALAQIVRGLAGIRTRTRPRRPRPAVGSLGGLEDGPEVAAQLAQLLGVGSGGRLPRNSPGPCGGSSAAAARPIVVVSTTSSGPRAPSSTCCEASRVRCRCTGAGRLLGAPRALARAPGGRWRLPRGAAAGDVHGLLASVGAPETFVAAGGGIDGQPLFAEEPSRRSPIRRAPRGRPRGGPASGWLNALLSARLDRLDDAAADR